MHIPQRQIISWVAGLAVLIAVAWYFQPSNFVQTLREIGIVGTSIWLCLIIIARLLLVEITVIPLRALNLAIRRSDAFWIGWMRSFCNLVFPLSGLAMYAHEIRRRTGMSWSEFAALSALQLCLAATALGLMGILATAVSVESLSQAAAPLMCTFAIVVAVATLATVKPGWLADVLPVTLTPQAKDSLGAFKQLAESHRTLVTLVSVHCAAIACHAVRIWILFAVSSVPMGWSEALLISAVAESAILLHLTPGGLGLREGAVIAVAALLGISPDAAAAVALIDRLFLVGITVVFAAPAFALTRRNESVDVRM